MLVGVSAIMFYSKPFQMKPPVARKPKHLQGEKLESDMKSPSTESLPPQVTGRAVIIKELIDTERTFLSDLLVIQEVFTLQGQSPISRSDHRILFGNLDSVIDISDTLYRGWDGHECISADFDYNSIVSLVDRLLAAFSCST